MTRRQLSSREAQVLKLSAQGLSGAAIARELNVTGTHISSTRRRAEIKMGHRGDVQAAYQEAKKRGEL